ncbi:hypothetical protein DINM_004213 [Dirofilaria immitis]|nr:hypothetical protein [Dirofilaria immitis]
MNRSSTNDVTVFRRSGVKFLRDFNWSVKVNLKTAELLTDFWALRADFLNGLKNNFVLVGDCDTALESLKPIVVLTLYFVEDITKTYEFTEKELERFIGDLEAIQQEFNHE